MFLLKTKNLFIFLLLLIFSCSKEERLKSYDIELKLTNQEKIAFNELYDTWQFSPLDIKLPKYYQFQLSKSGLKKIDSFVLYTWNTDYNKFYFEMYKKGFISKDEFIEKKIDSTIELSKPKLNQLIVALKIEKDRYLMRVDENCNKSLIDEKLFSFKKLSNLNRSDSLFIENFPTIKFNYWNFNEEKAYYFNRELIIYPTIEKNIYSSNTINETILNLKLNNYWLGNFEMDNQKYDFAVQGFYNSFLTILIKPDSLKFNKTNPMFNENYTYKLKDTIKLASKSFIIDSITRSVSKVILRPINTLSNYGFRVNQTIKNYRLDNLHNNQINLYTITKNKKYTILDFWGTWCKPCVESIPELKSFYYNNIKNVNLLSIAFDDSIDKVNDFVIKNEMNWHQFYVERENINSIVRDLNIKQYPTLILIDDDHQILYRGNKLEEIKKIIK